MIIFTIALLSLLFSTALVGMEKTATGLPADVLNEPVQEDIQRAANMYDLLKAPNNKLVLFINLSNTQVDTKEQPFTGELLSVFKEAPKSQVAGVTCIIQSRWPETIRERFSLSGLSKELSLRFAQQNRQAGTILACKHLDATLIQSRLFIIRHWFADVLRRQPQNGTLVFIPSPDLRDCSFWDKSVLGTEFNGGSPTVTLDTLLQTVAAAKQSTQDALATWPQLEKYCQIADNNFERNFERDCVSFFQCAPQEDIFYKVTKILHRNREDAYNVRKIVDSLKTLATHLTTIAHVYSQVRLLIAIMQETKDTNVVVFCDKNFYELASFLIHHCGFTQTFKNGLVSPEKNSCEPHLDAFVPFHRELVKTAKIFVEACPICGAMEKKLLKCGRCKNSYYCSEKCQKKDWQAGHKESCKPA